MPAAMTLTAYELEREERVRINKLKLQQMGLTATLNEISSTVKAQQHVRHPFFRSPRPITAAEREAQRMAIRRSDRCVSTKPGHSYLIDKCSTLNTGPQINQNTLFLWNKFSISCFIFIIFPVVSAETLAKMLLIIASKQAVSQLNTPLAAVSPASTALDPIPELSTIQSAGTLQKASLPRPPRMLPTTQQKL